MSDPLKIEMSLTAWSSINYRPTKTIEVDRDEWNEMSPVMRQQYMKEELEAWRDVEIEEGWKIVD